VLSQFFSDQATGKDADGAAKTHYQRQQSTQLAGCHAVRTDHE